jgi:hypothetical protein
MIFNLFIFIERGLNAQNKNYTGIDQGVETLKTSSSTRNKVMP